nr:MAG TPA: hypothetical protein [Caudoviricetes sp.]DAN23234.1 MAG TPA_asm: hypothetical protein [Bacteriophage sp.]
MLFYILECRYLSSGRNNFWNSCSIVSFTSPDISYRSIFIYMNIRPI